jgi:hypothetical protein
MGMTVIHREPYGDKEKGAELRIGWPSWDPTGQGGQKSIKYAYRRADGRIARSSPETPMGILPDMLFFADQCDELDLNPKQLNSLKELLAKHESKRPPVS